MFTNLINKGAAGKRTTGRLASVVGLDPGGPLFSLDDPSNRIDYSDADYVEVHITDGGRLGFEHPVANATFYPNWGGFYQFVLTQNVYECFKN